MSNMKSVWALAHEIVTEIEAGVYNAKKCCDTAFLIECLAWEDADPAYHQEQDRKAAKAAASATGSESQATAA